MYGSGLSYPEWANQAAAMMTVAGLALTWLLIRLRQARLEREAGCPAKASRKKPLRLDQMTTEQRQKVLEARQKAEEWNDMQRCRYSPRQQYIRRKQGLDLHWQNLEVLELSWRERQ